MMAEELGVAERWLIENPSKLEHSSRKRSDDSGSRGRRDRRRRQDVWSSNASDDEQFAQDSMASDEDEMSDERSIKTN